MNPTFNPVMTASHPKETKKQAPPVKKIPARKLKFIDYRLQSWNKNT